MTAPQLDEFDHKLIEMLSRDARVSNRKLAADLGVTEGTVRHRLRRMQKDRLIAFGAITSPGFVESGNIAVVAIEAEMIRAREIARQIATFPDIGAVMVAMGRFNILATCHFSELNQLREITSRDVFRMDGVHHVEISIAARTIKYNPLIARIVN